MRCERERPGEFVHVDVKRAVRIPDGRSGACAGFMSPSPVFFAGLGAAVERVMTVNGPGYRSREFNCPLEAEEGPAQTHVPLQPLAEREGRADEPDARAGVVVRKGVGRRGGQGRGPGRLHRALQFDPPPPPHGARRGSTAHVAYRRRKQPIGTQQLASMHVPRDGTDRKTQIV